MSCCDYVWKRLYANNEAANSAEQVLSEAITYLDELGGLGMPALCTAYQNGDRCTRFAWDSMPNLVMTVRWHTCCSDHPIKVDSVEFARK